jgi:hypothetical protein
VLVTEYGGIAAVLVASAPIMGIAVVNPSFGVMKKYFGVEERNIVHSVNRRKANWIGHMLRRN